MGTDKPKVSLVFPVYGQAGLLKRALTTLREVTRYPDYEVIVVDDCSREDMSSVYDTEGLYDRLIRLPENTGNSTEVVNRGVKESAGELIQYQNSDVYFKDPLWLDRIVEAFDAETAVVGPALLYPDGTVQSAGMFFDDRGVNRHLYRYRRYNTMDRRTLDVPMVTGCALTTRRDVYDELGGFRVFRPYGWDDADWCLRVREAGYRVRLCLASSLYHLGTVSYRGMDNPGYHENRKRILAGHTGLVEKDSGFRAGGGKKFVFFLGSLADNTANRRLAERLGKPGSGDGDEYIVMPLLPGGLKKTFQDTGARVFPPMLRPRPGILREYLDLPGLVKAERPDGTFCDFPSRLFLLPLTLKGGPGCSGGPGRFVPAGGKAAAPEGSRPEAPARPRPRRGERLLFVGHDLSLKGAPISMHQLVMHFEGLGYNVEVLAFGGGPLKGRCESIGVKTHVIKRPKNGIIRKAIFVIRVWRFLGREKYDLYFLNTIATAFLMKLPPLDAGRCIWCIRESERKDWLDLPGIRGLVKNRGLFDGPAAVVFVSEATRAVYADLDKRGEFRTIHNGIDTAVIDSYIEANPRDEARRVLGLEEARVFLSVGTVTERKGQKHLVHAAERYLRERPGSGAVFLMVGGAGTDYEREITEAVGKKGFSPWIRVVPETEDVFRYYAAADVFVFPSLVESLPRTVLEAMAFGLPIVSTDVFGVREQIEDGVSGLLVKPGEPDALYERLVQLEEDPELASSLGSAARRSVREKFPLEKTLAAYERLFGECLARLGGPAGGRSR